MAKVYLKLEQCLGSELERTTFDHWINSAVTWYITTQYQTEQRDTIYQACFAEFACFVKRPVISKPVCQHPIPKNMSQLSELSYPIQWFKCFMPISTKYYIMWPIVSYEWNVQHEHWTKHYSLWLINCLIYSGRLDLKD